ncbi:MAG: hypothetical protein KDK25_14915 [Leptospiraceae bacterium]|nr:hypothetical protein [Leptospiraceae bacterium]MCB1171636.1 hypothetical protein [Leptospiraceae bacterium]
MHRPPLFERLLLGLSTALFFLSIATGCQLFTSEAPDIRKHPVHLVIDAGSSGTRFCPFAIQAGTCQLIDPKQDCFSVEGSGGLADLSEAEVFRLMESGFQRLDGLEIQEAVLLGTGGFRKLPSSRQRTQLQIVESALQSQFALARAEIISGEEEARLAYLSVTAARGAKDHTILETGGATVQLAGLGRKPASVPAGLNAMRSLTGPPEACRPETAPYQRRFDDCVLALNDVLLEQDWYEDFFQKVDNSLPVFVLGSSWKSIFAIAGKSSMNLTELKDQAKRICNSSIANVEAEGVPARYAPDSCYLHSYQFLFLWSLHIGEFQQGDGSWPPGAAISDHFRSCSAN